MCDSMLCVAPTGDCNMNDEPGSDFRPLPMAAGMLMGALVGFVLWLATDAFVFLPVCSGAGLALGLILAGTPRT